MKSDSAFKNPLLKFFILTFVIFLVLFGIIGASLALNAPAAVPTILQIVCAWSPTFAFLILFRKLFPGQSLKTFLKQQFAPKVAVSQVLGIIGLQLLVLVCVAVAMALSQRVSFLSVWNITPSVIFLGFLNALIRGPLGEELGWRGYAQNHLQKRYSPLVASLIVGVVWGFWHTPLWIVTSGYAGIELLEYAGLFVVGLIAISVIMTFFYGKTKNLILPILIHLLLNYLGSLVNGDGLQTMLYTSLFYVIVAVILVLAAPKRFLQQPEAAAVAEAK